MADQRTRKAIQKCGEWLALCLRLGWSRDQLDALEALWWEHHDECGNLKTTAGVAPTALTREQINNFARQAGLPMSWLDDGKASAWPELERFARLVATGVAPTDGSTK